MREKLFWFLRLAVLGGMIAGILILINQYASEYASERFSEFEVGSSANMNNNEANKDEIIRVQILDSGFGSSYHKVITLTSDSDFSITRYVIDRGLVEEQVDQLIQAENQENEVKIATALFSAGEQVVLYPGDSYGAVSEQDSSVKVTDVIVSKQEILCVEGTSAIRIPDLKRQSGVPEYDGKLYVWNGQNGLRLLNVLPLEVYLYSVVASEMPSYFPLEALKAQAVCARTFAVNAIKNRGTNIADLNDSSSCQMYRNFPWNIQTKAAVDITKGIIMQKSEIQYYSTSCVRQAGEVLDSDTAFATFWDRIPDAEEENGSPWVRWTAELDSDLLPAKLFVQRRRPDGRIDTLKLSDGSEEMPGHTLNGEYEIRSVLGKALTSVTLLDGTVHTDQNLLPSAYFVVSDQTQESIVLKGSGFGHGNGMSQCGAAAMAAKGLDYSEIIMYYYGTEIRKGSIHEERNSG